ncbi:MAG TPA: hypothetical protein VGK48_16955 [Terriglobia bacterium]
MRARLFGLQAMVVLLLCLAQVQAQNIVSEWYPSRVGDSWMYEREELDGANGGIANPETGRWRVEETIESSARLPEGILILKRSRALDPLPVIAHRIPSIRANEAAYILIAGDCVYDVQVENNQLARQFREDLKANRVSAEFCFPMTQGKVWGRVADRPRYDPDFVWHMIGINADPYGIGGATTFHFSAREGSGTMVDRWFAKGIGLVQEITEHHGTYDESRLRLIRTTTNGQTRDYHVVPAHAVPLSSSDCDGYGWQHFVRADGSSFADHSSCVKYASH